MDYMRSLAQRPHDRVHFEDERTSEKEEPTTSTSFIVGLDLGQSHDWTAISVLQRKQTGMEKAQYQLRHLERPQLGTLYPAIVERVKELLSTGDLLADRHS